MAAPPSVVSPCDGACGAVAAAGVCTACRPASCAGAGPGLAGTALGTDEVPRSEVEPARTTHTHDKKITQYFQTDGNKIIKIRFDKFIWEVKI